MKKNEPSVSLALLFFATLALGCSQPAAAATDWSTQDYDLYAGDFNGDGKTDILYIAKDPSKVSGIALSDGTGPNVPWQSWQSNFLGIAWYGNSYNVVVADFNGDKKADIFLQAKAPGDNYLILTGTDGHIRAISQTVGNGAMGLTWSADQHRIIAGDFNGDHRVDLFLQATSVSGVNAVVLADQNGQFTASSPYQTWQNNYLGLKWSTQNATVYAGDFNGDGLWDLLVQAKPVQVMIGYDVPFPVPTYPPNMNGVVLAHAGSPIFSLSGVQTWSRKSNGVDWSGTQSALVVGDFNGDGKTDVIVQSKNGATTLLIGNATGAMLSASATVLSGNVSLAGTRLVAAAFGGAAAGLYVQSSGAGDTNYVIDGVGANFTAAVQTPSLGMGVVTATAVGRTAGQFSISPTGGALYDIPIWTPPGARDIEPHLALHYISGGPDGVMGPGWALAGISLIARCNKTWAANGAPAGVTLATTDDLCLDGNRLRSTTSFTPACAGGTIYQTEIADFSNITACGATGNGPSYFIIQGKDGRTYQYGNGGNSQVFASGSTTPYAWGLNEVLDRQGNNMVFTYAASSTILTPNTIRYTQTPATGASYPYTVMFNYTGRAGGTAPTKYVAGYAVTQTNELINIAVSYAGTLVRQYNLSYSVSPTTLRPRLSNVQECAGSAAAECSRPTTINYQPGAAGLSTSATLTGLTGQFGFICVDLNGDGIPDALYARVSNASIHWYAKISTLGGYGAEIDTGASTPSGISPITGAFSGSGRVQFLAPVGNTWYVYTYIDLPPGSTTGSFTSASTAVGVANEQFTLDWDGDGLPDLVATDGASTVTVRRNTTSSGGAVAFSNTPQIVYSGTSGQKLNVTAPLTPADFDGDGRSDLLVRVISVNTGKGYTRFASFALRSQGFAAAPLQSALGVLDSGAYGASTALLGDWNGDGCTDIVTQDNVYLSNCAGAFTAVPTGIPLFSASTAPYPYPIRLADIDGDGQSDLLYEDPTSNSWYVARSTGTGVAKGAPLGIPAPTTRAFSVIDRDCDGQPDLMYVDSSNGYTVGYYLHSGRNTPPDLAISVSDGFGMAFTPTYVPISQSNYTKGTGAQFPNIDYQGPLYVVNQFGALDGLGGTYQTVFSYSAARLNQQGRGFLGFASTSTQDMRTNIQHNVSYRQDFPLIGSIAEDDYFQPGGVTPINTTTKLYTLVTLDGTANHQRVFGYLSSATVQKYEVGDVKNGSPVANIATTYAEDSFGNVTNTRITLTDTDAALGSAPASPFKGLQWTTAISSSIANDSGPNWCIGRPSTTTTQKTAPGEPTLTRTVNHTIDYTNCRATQEILEPGNQRLQVTTTFGFLPAGCGNITSVSVVGLDQNGNPMPARTVSTSYGTACELAESVTDSLGQTTATQYDYRFVVPTQSYDINNLLTSSAYDDFGRKTQETGPDGTSTSWTYSDCVGTSCWGTSNLRFLVTERFLDNTHTPLRTSEKYYDGLDRLTFEEGHRVLGIWTNHAIIYNNLGQKYQDYLPYSIASNGYHQYTYDLAGRLTHDTLYDSGGNPYRSTGLQYFGQTVTTTDPIGNVTNRVADVAGLLRRVIDPSSTASCPKGYTLCGTTQYDYDSFGNLLTLTDAIGARSSFTYNLRGFKTSATNADSGAWTFTPNSLNELVSQEDALNQVTSFVYDPLGRMISRLEPESTTPTQWTYGASVSAHNCGRVQSVTKPDGYSENYLYDGVGRPSSVTFTEDGTGYVFGYAYNAAGVVDTLTYPTSTGSKQFALKYVYDAYGFLRQLRDANTGALFWNLSGANDSSFPTSELLGNGVQIATAYTPWTNEMIARSERTVGATTNLQIINYRWDVNGNLQQRQDLRQALTEAFTTDALNRLTTVTLNGTQTLSVMYDAAGDILNKSDVGNYIYGDPRHPHAVTAAGSWTIGYDTNGNMSSRAGGAITSNSYNLPNQIAYNGNTDLFYYNSDHKRWKQVASYAGTTETTHYIGGLLEVTTRGSAATEYRHQIPAGSSTVVYTRRSDGTSGTYYATTDHLGSSDLVLDSSANVLARESFTPFGARRGSNWQNIPTTGDYAAFASTTRRGFTGHEMLDAVGLIHMDGRVYDPYLGRFLSADTIVQALEASPSVNPYSYAWNDPLRYVDPDGHSLLGDIVGLIASIVAVVLAPYVGLPALVAEGGAGIATAVVAGFVGGFVGAAVSTGSLAAALQAGLIGAASAALFYETGSFADSDHAGAEWRPAASVLAHAAVGCASAVASGGNCGKGAVAAALSEAAVRSDLIKPADLGTWGSVQGIAEAGIVGGAGSVIGGGRFADGFSVGAAGYLFNALGHSLVGQDAHQVLLRYLQARDIATLGDVWDGNTGLSGLFGGGRPDLLYDLPSGGYYGWEIKPYGQDADALIQLQRYIAAAAGDLIRGDNTLIFGTSSTLTLPSIWFFQRTEYTYYSGVSGVVTYKATDTGIFEFVTSAYKKRTDRGQSLVPFAPPPLPILVPVVP